MILQQTQPETKILWSVVIVSLIVVGLTFLMRAIDTGVNTFFNGIRTEGGIEVMRWVSWLAELKVSAVVFISATFFLLWKKHYRSSALVGICMSGVLFISSWLKEFFERARPQNLIVGGYGFPSGHTTAATLLYGSIAIVLWKRNKAISVGCMLIALLVGISRMYLGVHWLSDVAGGILFGSGWILLWYLLIWRRPDAELRTLIRRKNLK